MNGHKSTVKVEFGWLWLLRTEKQPLDLGYLLCQQAQILCGIYGIVPFVFVQTPLSKHK